MSLSYTEILNALIKKFGHYDDIASQTIIDVVNELIKSKNIIVRDTKSNISVINKVIGKCAYKDICDSDEDCEAYEYMIIQNVYTDKYFLYSSNHGIVIFYDKITKEYETLLTENNNWASQDVYAGYFFHQSISMYYQIRRDMRLREENN